MYARAHQEASRPFIRAHAREMDETGMASHIATFANDYSVDLGEDGRLAITALLQAAAKEAGIVLPPSTFFAGRE